MRKKLSRVVLLLCVYAVAGSVFAQDSSNTGQPSVLVNEKSARLALQEKTSVFTIDISSCSAQIQSAELVVKVITPNGNSEAAASEAFQLTPSPKRVGIKLNWVPKDGLDDVATTRLFYEVSLAGAISPAASGVLSPYKIIPDLFELHFTGLDAIGLGRTYIARVRATNPETKAPVSGVALTGLLGDTEDSDAPKEIRPRARTNSRGEAVLKFRLPEFNGAPDDSEIDLEIKGSLGNFKNSLTCPIHFWRRAAILLSTDKPLYQPEQTLHVRALLIDDQRRAWPKQPVRFVIQDPDETTIFSADAVTSHFGIASTDWSIPDSQKLGMYKVHMEITGDGDNRNLQVYQNVRISRYELPTFTVNAQLNQTFYLPGQNADLTVSASYLFGKPVLRGHVRVVREASRTWNYHLQKWDVEETSSDEGELNAKNEFHITLDLSKAHSNLAEQDWKRFEDVHYAAYLTDASSGHTQERHFDIRVTRDPIHIYALNTGSSIPSGMPQVLYLSTAFADGTPTPADLNIQLFTEDPSDHDADDGPLTPFAKISIQSNKYGIARAIFPAPSKKDEDDHLRVYALIEAKSSGGRTGKHLESYSLNEGPALRISPERVVLNPREAIVAKIESSVPSPRIRVDAIRAETQSILASQEINLSRGSARVTFIPDDQFAGKITLIAYRPDEEETGYYASLTQVASASVIFPESTLLKLDATPVKQSYRPGESAAVNLQVRGPQGEFTEGVFGFLVYDQALEELARTEASLSTESYDRINPNLGFQNNLDEDFGIAGISEKDLLNRAPGSPISPDVELVAEALYASQPWAPMRLEASDSSHDFARTFSQQIKTALASPGRILEAHFAKTGHYPVNDETYSDVLKQSGIDSSRLLDPWNRPYHVRRTYKWTNEILEFRSDGPDKTTDSPDDFTAFELSGPFFGADETRLRAIIAAYQKNAGSFIRDEATLKLACEQEHTSLSSFVDPWGTPYRFEFNIQRDNFYIQVSTAGPDKKFRSEKGNDYPDYDDVYVATIRTPYFAEIYDKIDAALFENAKAYAHFPENEREFAEALKRFGIDWSSLRDPWGHPYRVRPSIEHNYSDKITVRAYGQNVSSSSAPVTRAYKALTILSNGADGIAGNEDDFTLGQFIAPFHEETGGQDAEASMPQKAPLYYKGNSGAVSVRVMDPIGGIIQGAEVRLTNQVTSIEYTGITNDQGVYLVGNLPAGSYRLLVRANGFQAYVLSNVPVLSSNVSIIEVKLNLGATAQTVTVEASAVQLQTEMASVSALAGNRIDLTSKSGTAKGRVEMQLGTPRLREYFPETLVWRPEVLTDRAGHATVKFPLADSITTWKVSVIASTLDGHIATASINIRAFQPFFAELDPPKVLTVGDEIHLPVTVRNYLDKQQSVLLDWASEPWSQTLSPRNAQVDVTAGDYSQKVFSFRAALPTKEAKQRVTAFNRSSKNQSDAIERKLRVHADGQERFLQSNAIFSGSTTLSLNLPTNALPGSIESELVIYPNLLAHVSDAIEGIMERPYGCAEQTISSAYPSLLWLQLQKSQKLPASPLDARAAHYLKLAYAKLLGYRDSAGGFSYWGKGEAYIPLTAFALRFLTEASEFIEVDSKIIDGTRQWLIQQASPTGVWTRKDSAGQAQEWATDYYTTYVVQILARDLLRADRSDKKEIENERDLVSRGITLLSKSIASESDPYRIALLALAKLSIKQDASGEIAYLLAKQHGENETVYWDLQKNTLFYGWGLSGRIEATALVLEALATAKQEGNNDPALDRALNLGTHFLLKNKDRYHVWYSTQATVNVLQCLVRQIARDGAEAESKNSPSVILLDGKPGPEFPVSKDARRLTPLRVDLTSYIAPGLHRVEIRGGSFSHASAYLNASYYLSWTDPSVIKSFVPTGDSESLRYSVQFNHTVVSAGEEVHCTVHTERLGFRGYGMMLAEVGLPPGAEVDRASLDEAIASSNWSVQSYEVQPDRVVFYLWPSAGGTTFSFTLKPRYGMNAQSAESILYDYYNPLARASVQPIRFNVQ